MFDDRARSDEGDKQDNGDKHRERRIARILAQAAIAVANSDDETD